MRVTTEGVRRTDSGRVVLVAVELEAEDLEQLDAAYMTAQGERPDWRATDEGLGMVVAAAGRARLEELLEQGGRRLETLSLLARGEISAHRASLA